MTINKLAIIGGSGLYDVEEFKKRELLDLNTPWGKPSDKILKTNYNNKEVYFFPDGVIKYPSISSSIPLNDILPDLRGERFVEFNFNEYLII